MVLAHEGVAKGQRPLPDPNNLLLDQGAGWRYETELDLSVANVKTRLYSKLS